MKPLLLIVILLAFQSSECGNAGTRQEDQRKAARPVPATGSTVMAPGHNQPGTIRLNQDQVPEIVFPGGVRQNATETQPVLIPQ